MVSYLTYLGIDSDFTGAPNFTQLVFCYRIIRLLQVSVAWFLRKGDKNLYMKKWVKLTQHPLLRVPGCFFGFQVIRTGSVGMHLWVPGSQWPTGGLKIVGLGDLCNPSVKPPLLGREASQLKWKFEHVAAPKLKNATWSRFHVVYVVW